MVEVQILHLNKGSGALSLVRFMDLDILKRYSKTARDSTFYDPQNNVYKLIISDATWRSVCFIVGEIIAASTNRLTTNLNVRMIINDLKEALDNLQAATVLQLEPAQPQIEAHITSYLTKHLVKARERVHIVSQFGSPESAHHIIFKTMTHMVAYKWVHNQLRRSKRISFEKAWRAGGRFGEAMDRKVAKLEEKKEWKAAKAAKEEMEETEEAEDAQAADNSQS